MLKLSQIAAVAGVFSAVLLATSMPARAVIAGPLSREKTLSIAPPASQVERGGPINSLDLNQKIIRIDGVVWPLSSASLPVTEAARTNPSRTARESSAERQNPAGIASLKALAPGMQIRFITLKKSPSSTEQVMQIEVVHAPLLRSKP